MKFKSVHVEGRTIDSVWFKLLVEVCNSGRVYKIDSGSFAGDFRLEFDFVTATITNPISFTESGVMLPLAVTVPQGCPAPTSEDEIVKYFINYLMDGNLAENEHYKYASFIVGGEYHIPKISLKAPFVKADHKTRSGLMSEFKGPIIEVPNQLQWVIDHYKSNGFGNNHCLLQVGYPESQWAYSIPYKNEMERQTSPCLRLIDTKIIKEGDKFYLNFYTYFRSWDCYSGMPENLGGIALLLHYMAGELGVEEGAIVAISKGLHVYGHSIEPLALRSGNSEIAERFKKIKENLSEVLVVMHLGN